MLPRCRPIATDAYACAEGADALVIVTEWEQFRALDLERLKQRDGSSPVMVDLRNIYRPEEHAPPALPMRASGGPEERSSFRVVVPRRKRGPNERMWQLCFDPDRSRSTQRCRR